MLEFVVEIESRPLGVRFAHADRGETVLVHLVLENKLGHKLGLLPGDILIAVNNKSVLDIKSTEALNLFRQTQCPFNASFRRFDDDDEFDDDDDDELNDTNNNNTNNNDTNNNDNNDDNTNNNDANNDNNNETDNKVDDSNVNIKTKKLTAETEYQREQARQLQYNIETQIPKSVLKHMHKRQVSITLNTWKSDDVQEWLLNIGDEQEFKKYIKIFNDNNIDGKKLNGMNKNDLENIGIQPNDIQKLYNEIQKSNKIFINPPLKPIINPKSGLTTQIKKVSEANETTNDDDNNDDDDDDQKASTNNENNDTTNDTTNNDTNNNNNDDETAEETGDNWEAPFLPYMYDAPTITLSAKTIVKVYTSRIVAPYKKRAFALYEIEVIEGKEEWLLSKRYSEFYRLYESMKKLGVKTKITFPKKGLFTKSTDKQVMEERKKKLTNYLNELLKDHEIARKSKELNDFLSPSRTFVVDE